MKIVLVRYHDNDNVNTRLPEALNKVQGVYPPLGISYIAAILKQKGYDVQIIDTQALNITNREFESMIRSIKPDVVGITAMTPTIRGAMKAAMICKSHGAIVVMGGPHIATLPNETMASSFIDYGLIGEGDYSFLALIQYIEGKIVSLKNVEGIIYKHNKKVIINKAALVENLDELPFPARELLPNDRYDCIITEKPFTTMISSRGCPYRCGFCFKTPSDNKNRTRNPKNIVDEMEYCIDKFKVKEIMFYDDTLTLNREVIVKVCEEIISRKLDINWEAPTRVNHIDLELLKLMKKAGCIRLRYGVESGDQSILNLMRKGTTIDQIRKVFKWSHEVGIETFAYFIIGYYSETPQTMQNTINFAKEINPDWAMFTVATPLPKTHLHELALKDNLIPQNYWEEFTELKRNDRLPYLVPDADKWVKKAYRSFYFRPSFVIKKIRKLNSWDTLKKYIDGARGIIEL
ncbi:cobalamin B12-binding domain-containing protein [Candidatus Woesearchaeota archaeon]|nr:cobalamin B12-binding domain-containing protein [Candidatus Woesearchaeota archaeon]